MKRQSLQAKLFDIIIFFLKKPTEKFIRLFTKPNAFFDVNEFSWVEEIESDFITIQNEMNTLINSDVRIPEFRKLSKRLAGGITKGKAWQTHMMYLYGYKSTRGCRACPLSDRIIQKIPGMTTAFFSILTPGTRLSPHRGPYNGVLRYHLALKVPRTPELCGLRVKDEARYWEEGKSLVFDDAYDHEAWNNSEEVRIVLFVDFLRPLPKGLNVWNRLMVWLIRESSIIQNTIDNIEEEH